MSLYGNLCCLEFLSVADSPVQGRCTVILVCALIIVTIYLAETKRLNYISLVLCFIFFGAVQFILVYIIDYFPSKWDSDYDLYYYLMASFGSFPVRFVAIYCIYKSIKLSYINIKIDKMIYAGKKIKPYMELQLNTLLEIRKELEDISSRSIDTEKLLELLVMLSDDSLKKAYSNMMFEREKNDLLECRKKALNSKILLDVQGKSSTEVKIQVEKIISNRRKMIDIISKKSYDLKDYKALLTLKKSLQTK